MKKNISSVLLLMVSINSFADCDFKTGITPTLNKTFIYSEECHQKVGSLVKANQDLTQALQLKDLALSTADQRTQLWTKATEDEQDRMLKLNSDKNKSDWVMFGLGAVTVLATGFVIAKLVGH